MDQVIPWDPMAERKQLEKVLSADVELKPGDRVVLRPHAGGDVMDIALRGKAATIAAIEQDFENRIHVAVTIDEDPGRDFGMAGKPGHRLFFSLDEVEIVENDGRVRP